MLSEGTKNLKLNSVRTWHRIRFASKSRAELRGAPLSPTSPRLLRFLEVRAGLQVSELNGATGRNWHVGQSNENDTSPARLEQKFQKLKFSWISVLVPLVKQVGQIARAN